MSRAIVLPAIAGAGMRDEAKAVLLEPSGRTRITKEGV